MLCSKIVRKQCEIKHHRNEPQGINPYSNCTERFDHQYLFVPTPRRHSNGSTEDGEDQADDGQSLSRSASENSVAPAQHERNNNESTNG